MRATREELLEIQLSQANQKIAEQAAVIEKLRDASLKVVGPFIHAEQGSPIQNLRKLLAIPIDSKQIRAEWLDKVLGEPEPELHAYKNTGQYAVVNADDSDQGDCAIQETGDQVMTTKREKIIQLVTQCFPMDIRRGLCFDDAEAFYKAAQAEAFEDDAVMLEGKLAHTFGRHCAEEIRKMAKEKQNATDA